MTVVIMNEIIMIKYVNKEWLRKTTRILKGKKIAKHTYTGKDKIDKLWTTLRQGQLILNCTENMEIKFEVSHW